MVAVGGTPLIHFQKFVNNIEFYIFMPEVTKINPTTDDKPDAGQQARANDVVDALIEIKAWQDSQRKAEAEATELKK